jgi:hypothetical protein
VLRLRWLPGTGYPGRIPVPERRAEVAIQRPRRGQLGLPAGPPGLGKCADARHPQPWASCRRDPRPAAARYARPPSRARSPSKREPGMAPSRAPGGGAGACRASRGSPHTAARPQARRETATSPSQTEPLSAFSYQGASKRHELDDRELAARVPKTVLPPCAGP